MFLVLAALDWMLFVTTLLALKQSKNDLFFFFNKKNYRSTCRIFYFRLFPSKCRSTVIEIISLNYLLYWKVLKFLWKYIVTENLRELSQKIKRRCYQIKFKWLFFTMHRGPSPNWPILKRFPEKKYDLKMVSEMGYNCPVEKKKPKKTCLAS